MSESRRLVQDEFERAAEGFSERTKGRFDDMDAVAFSRVAPGARVLEVGAGTGNFLSLFSGLAGQLIAVDITHGMLATAVRSHEEIVAIQGEGERLPLTTGAVDIATSAQAFHHIQRPVPVLKEMARVTKPDGFVFIVDQLASENYEEALVMNQLELIRDPSHAMSRPVSAFRVMVQAAGLEIVDENIWEGRNSFSKWMWPGEFPKERIEQVRTFVDEAGHLTGMDFRKEDGEWTFRRRRLMMLARRPS